MCTALQMLSHAQYQCGTAGTRFGAALSIARLDYRVLGGEGSCRAYTKLKLVWQTYLVWEG